MRRGTYRYAQAAMWAGLYAKFWKFLGEAKILEGGAKPDSVDEELAEIERLLDRDLANGNVYGIGVEGRYMRSAASGVAPLVASDVALPKRCGYFDLATFLTDPTCGKRM